ncbi:MAG: ferrochelatase [Dysgonamonadaceae bacterium]
MRGIILMNVGTPGNCKKADVQKFIGDMLADPLVLGKPEWISSLLARKIIAPLSASKSLKKYQLIWRKEEPSFSPITYYLQNLADKLEKQKNVPVEIAMRYGEPTFSDALKKLEKRCPLLHELVVFPMYPHYAQSTTQTAIDEVGRIFYKHPHSFRLKFVSPYYKHPAYIKALADFAKPYLEKDLDRLVFCYHSLPINQIEEARQKGKEFDYVYQLKETNHLLAEQLDIAPNKIIVLYSSQRSDNWIKPYLNKEIGDLPRMGWKKIAVMAPGFLIDNMETLYDIDIEARGLFLKDGGEDFTFIPCLNDSDLAVESIWKIISGV